MDRRSDNRRLIFAVLSGTLAISDSLVDVGSRLASECRPPAPSYRAIHVQCPTHALSKPPPETFPRGQWVADGGPKLPFLEAGTTLVVYGRRGSRWGRRVGSIKCSWCPPLGADRLLSPNSTVVESASRSKLGTEPIRTPVPRRRHSSLFGRHPPHDWTLSSVG